MTSILLEYSREDAKTVIKSAFERTSGIKEYADDGHRIIGKTGMGIASYGEKVIVEIPETQSAEDETMISVSAEKEVSVNVTANPDKYKSRFLQELETLRGRDIGAILDDLSGQISPEQTKEVNGADQMRDGSSNVVLVVIATMVIMFFFMMLMMAAVTP